MSNSLIATAIARTRERHRSYNSEYDRFRQRDIYRCTCGHGMRYADEYGDHYDSELARNLAETLGLTRAWAAVLPDGSYFGPYHETMSPNAREQAEKDVAEYEDAVLSTRWVTGWAPATT